MTEEAIKELMENGYTRESAENIVKQLDRAWETQVFLDECAG